MKKLLSFFLFICFSAFTAKANESLLKAEQAYDAKRYKEAIAEYEKLVKAGYTSYELYFNLGNSYYRNDQLGKAIHAFEIARKIEPNDEDVSINLGIAASKTIDKIDTKENFFISAVKTNLLSSFSTNTWAWFSIAFLFISCATFFFFTITSHAFLKRLSFVLSLLALFSFFSTYALGYSAVAAKYQNKFAIILVKEVKIMNEPTLSANTKFRLHEGTKIRVVENNGDWLLIKLENGNEGWLKSTEVGII